MLSTKYAILLVLLVNIMILYQWVVSNVHSVLLHVPTVMAYTMLPELSLDITGMLHLKLAIATLVNI